MSQPDYEAAARRVEYGIPAMDGNRPITYDEGILLQAHRVVDAAIGQRRLVSPTALVIERDEADGKDGTPAVFYDEDGYCRCCGNGRWKHHMPDCGLRDSLDALHGSQSAAAVAAFLDPEDKDTPGRYLIYGPIPSEKDTR